MADAEGTEVGRLTAVMRYPVKSTGGESLTTAEVTGRGIVGDRTWATYTRDGGIGSCKTTRRFRRIDGLLEIGSSLEGDDVPILELPDGTRCRSDDPRAVQRLHEVLGVHLEIRPEEDVPHHDEVPIHIVTTAGIRRLERLLGETIEAVRFRPNLVVDVPGDDLVDGAWRGRDLAVGDDVVLRVGDTMPRCRMVGLAQRGLPERQGLLARMADVHGPGFGLRATVVHRGQVHAGDRVVFA